MYVGTDITGLELASRKVALERFLARVSSRMCFYPCQNLRHIGGQKGGAY